MKTFHCDACGSLVFFENVICVKCGHDLGFLPEVLDLSAVEWSGPDTVRALTPEVAGAEFRLCANARDHSVCNWLVPAAEGEDYCESCRLNLLIPALGVPENHARWYRLELAKRRVLYTLRKLGLPTAADPAGGIPALRFRFLGDLPGAPPVLTGHLQGVITVNIAEADDDVREQRRVSLHEPLRTLLGHFRHEVAHYYWDRLIAGTGWLDRFRDLFGDEGTDYGLALRNHYHSGPPSDWHQRSVSAYASSHPWEDWAETWAHYLHIVDTIETAAGFGMSLHPRHPDAKSMTAEPGDPVRTGASFDDLLATWFPLTYALNALNRGMGLPDLYPFVLSRTSIEKLRFVHLVVESVAEPAGRPR